MAPAWRSPSRFPGSKNAMLIKNPGPVNSQSFFHEKGGGTLPSSTLSNSKSATRIFSPSSDDDSASSSSSRSRFASSSLSSSFDSSSRDGALIVDPIRGKIFRRARAAEKPVCGGLLLRVHTQMRLFIRIYLSSSNVPIWWWSYLLYAPLLDATGGVELTI